MNLKEAFRFQNKLQRLMDEAESILSREKNVVKIENTALLHKVNPDAANEVTLELPDTEYAEQITQVATLLMYLLEQRRLLGYAIRSAKAGLELDFDGEVSLNGKRQEVANVLRRMSEIRSSEALLPGAGIGYKFNAEGNQVSYRCDLRRVTTINFDRNKVRSLATGLSQTADRISAQLDTCLVCTQVDYQPPFDVNDSFSDVLQWYLEQ